MKQDFFHSNGSISIINTSARKHGGALLLSSSWGRDNLAVACGGSTGSQKRSFERHCVDVSGRVLLANWSLIMVSALCLVCSMMFSKYLQSVKNGFPDLLYISAIAQISPNPGAIYVKQNFHHLGGSISVEGTSAGESGGAVLESSSGVAGDRCLW